MRNVMVLLMFFGMIASCGDDKVTEADLQRARAYADEHWIESKYIDDREHPTTASWYGWWEEWYGTRALYPLKNELTHRLPETRNVDYYEMIGIYDQFVYGWDDVHGDPLSLEPGDSTLAPNYDILIWSETGLDTAHFDPYIHDVYSEHRETYLDMITLR